MARNRIKSHHCNNCNYDFRIEPEHNNYCPNCGQENHNPRSPFLHYVQELLEGLFHFDNKIFKTYKILILQPGQLTINYLQNKRANYVPPLRLFIFTLAIFIVILFMVDKPVKMKNDPALNNISLSEQFDKLSDTAKIKLTRPFPWSNDLFLSVYKLRKLKQTSESGVAKWINENNLSHNIFNRLYFMSYRKMINYDKPSSQYLQKKNKVKYGAMFFIVPLLAFLFLLFFYKKKLFYYDVLIFSLHILTYWMLAGICVALIQAMVLQASSDFDMFPILYPSSLITILFFTIPASKNFFRLPWIQILVRLFLTTSCMIFLWITGLLVIEAYGIL